MQSFWPKSRPKDRNTVSGDGGLAKELFDDSQPRLRKDSKDVTETQAQSQHSPSPQNNTSSSRLETPKPSSSGNATLDSSKSNQSADRNSNTVGDSSTVTSVIRSSHYQNLQLRLRFKSPLITKPQPVNTSPFTGRSSYKLPPPPDIKALGEYEVVKTIGSGSTGKVQLAIHSTTKERVAIKCIIRQRPGMEPVVKSKESTTLREKRIFREASILYLLKHPHIVGLRDFFVCDEYFCMIFEYVEGVQLFDYITGNGKLRERAARKFMRQMLSAIDYCHQNSVAHRDLKIENMLVDMNGNIKILDFGLSNFYRTCDSLKTFCGSLYFAAPELLTGRPYIGPEVDIWALGIVLYVMTCGKVPFDDKNLPALHDKIKRCDIQYPSHLSDELKSLLQMMINPDNKKRATMSEVINHPWVNQGFNFTVRNFVNDRVPLDSIDETILTFMTREFRTHYSHQQIAEALNAALIDWNEMKDHPIISLYYLARDKLVRDGVLMPAGFRPLGTRSPSCPDLVAPPTGAAIKSEFTDAQRTRNLSVSVVPIPAEKNGPPSPNESGLVLKQPRSRSKSLSAAQVTSPIDECDVKTVYLKGLFSVNSTSKKSPEVLRRDIANVLQDNGIKFENRGAIFSCEYLPSVAPVVPGQSAQISFEIHIVRVAVFGQFGVLFKRIEGDLSIYKNLCNQILAELDL